VVLTDNYAGCFRVVFAIILLVNTSCIA